MRKLLLIIILAGMLSSNIFAQNPKYEKILKNLIRHQKEYVGKEVGEVYNRLKTDDIPIRWANSQEQYNGEKWEIAHLCLTTNTRYEKRGTYCIYIELEVGTMRHDDFIKGMPWEPNRDILTDPDNNPYVKAFLEKSRHWKVKSIECNYEFLYPLEAKDRLRALKKNKNKKVAVPLDDDNEVIRIHEPGY